MDAARADDAALRLGAELRILAGDVRQLARGRPGKRERAGLQDRLRGELAALPLLMRRAGDDAGGVPALRILLERGDWEKLGEALETLGARRPYAPGWLAQASGPDRIAQGAALHRTYCAGCHDADWGDVRLPARRLPHLAADQPVEEFAARLWLGVRGTREIAYVNPFDDGELAALLAYYRSPR